MFNFTIKVHETAFYSHVHPRPAGELTELPKEALLDLGEETQGWAREATGR